MTSQARSSAAAEGGNFLKVWMPAVRSINVEGWGLDVDGVERPGHRKVLGVGVGSPRRLGGEPGQRTSAGDLVGCLAADDLQYGDVGQRLEAVPSVRVLEPCLGDECYLSLQKQNDCFEEQLVRPHRQLVARSWDKAWIRRDHAFLDLVATQSGTAEGGSQSMGQRRLARTARPGDDDQGRYAHWADHIRPRRA